MARLALVSRNPIMSMGLSGRAHDIVEVRPSALDEWLAEGNDADVDALVLDLGTPGEALRVVGDLRAGGRWTPTLIVAGSSRGWDSPELSGLPGVDLLTLPIDAARLQRAADSVLRHPRTPPPILPTLNPPEDRAPLLEDFEEGDAIPEPILFAGSLDDIVAPTQEPRRAHDAPTAPTAPEPVEVLTPNVKKTPDLALEAQPSPPKVKPPTPLPSVPPTPRTTPIPVREVEVEETAAERPKAPRKQRKKSESAPASKARRSDKPANAKKISKPKEAQQVFDLADSGLPAPAPDQRVARGHARAPNPHPRRRATDRLPDQGPGEVVEVLLESANVLYTLAETAEVIVEDAIERAGANSGALLVPDGAVWRVSGGVGLRPMEHRYQLTDESWLIERVGESHRGLLVENSDVARQTLHGAPLASHAHLLAVPVPEVAAVLLLSRDEDPPFSEAVLGALAQLAREAGPLLRRAIDLRALSRALARHLDAEDGARENEPA